jgi:predicted SAM-dependent methyltransferase
MSQLFVYLGAGNDRIQGFTHIEINVNKQFKNGKVVERPEIIGDITQRLDLEDNCVDFIYSNQTMEHLTYPEFIDCLIECKRILKVGGVIRISVPSLDAMISDYMAGVRAEEDEWEIDPNMPLDNHTDLFISRLLYHDHRYLHNFDTLERALKRGGFEIIQEKKPGDVGLRQVTTLIAAKEVNRKGDIIVEAVKTTQILSVNQFRSPDSRRLIQRILNDIFNIRIGRYKRLLPMFPERRWFLEQRLKRKNSVLYASYPENQ